MANSLEIETGLNKAFEVLNNPHIGLNDPYTQEAGATLLKAREVGLLPGIPSYRTTVDGTNTEVVFPNSLVLPTRRNGGQQVVVFKLGLKPELD